MSATSNRLALTRRSWILLAVVEVVLFVIANVTAKSTGHPGTASQIAWVVFLVGVLLMIVLGVAAVIRSRR
jgi:uncharacterized membrane protein YtjA (UPF0391 family)